MFKFVEAPENNERQPLDQKSKDKFKIMSLKVKGGIDYVPELVSHIGPLAKYFCLAFLSILMLMKISFVMVETSVLVTMQFVEMLESC